MEKNKSACVDIGKITSEGKTVVVNIAGATAKGGQKLLKSLILKAVKDGKTVFVDEFSSEDI